MRNLLLATAVGLTLAGCGGSDGDGGTGSSIQAAATCEAHVEGNLLFGSYPTGEVTVSTAGSDLVVQVTTINTWAVASIDVYAGPGPVPVDGAGLADPSQFPHHLDLASPATTAELRIPLADLAFSCGDSLTVAVHSGVGITDSGSGGLLEVLPAWAGSEAGFAYAPCCEPNEPAREDPGCTLGKGSWKNDPDAWPVHELRLGSEVYTRGELLAVLGVGAKGDSTVILGQQAIAAKLNVAAGVQAPEDVLAALDAADAWFDENGVQTIPGLIRAGCAAGREATSLSATLGSFNAGLAGVPLCQ